MKIICQWKDPDFAVCSIDGEYNAKAFCDLPEDVQEALTAVGAFEYIVVQFDTETLAGEVIQ